MSGGGEMNYHKLKATVYAIGTGVNYGFGFIGYWIIHWPTLLDKSPALELNGTYIPPELSKELKPDQSPSNPSGDLEERL